MIRYLLLRLLQSMLVVVGVLTLVFLLLNLTGDPVALLVPVGASASDIAQLRRSLGLDQPLYARYALFMLYAARGDFGESVRYGQPALGLVLERLPATAALAGLALAILVLVGFPLGILAASRRDSAVDTSASAVALVGQSLPSFWLATILILVFAVRWRVFPTSGSGSFRALVLPAITLASFGVGVVARMVRSSLLETMSADYIRTARAKGLPNSLILSRHAMRNALIGPITVIGLQVNVLIGGAVVTEQVFAYPGMARLATQAVLNRDFPIVEAFVFVTVLVVLSVNLLIDFLYVLIDPRIKLQAGSS